MIIGVTGTRHGMSDAQFYAVFSFFQNNQITELHHGDCVGVDFEVATIAQELGIKTIAHPPEKDEYRAFHPSDLIKQSFSYFKRNRNIVDISQFMLVIPYDNDRTKGGTWYTYNYARRHDKPLKIFERNVSE